jgi:small-conductance mechanosensitive channel
MRLARALAMLAAAAWLSAAAAVAQEPAAPQGAEPPAASPAAPAGQAAPVATDERAALEARRAEAANDRAALEAQRASASGDARARLDADIEKLERIERLIGRQLDALTHAEELAKAAEEADRSFAAEPGAGLGREPPYPIALLDELLDALARTREQGAALEAAVAQAEAQLAEAKEAVDAREQERRAAKEAAEAATPDPAAGARAREDLRRAELASRVARERAVLAERQLANARAELEVQRKREQALARHVEWVEDHLALTPAELEEALAAIERREFAVRDGLERVAQEQKSAERSLAAAQKRFDAAPVPDPALVAELEARRLAQLAAQRRAALLNEELERLAELRTLWQRRVKALRGEASRAELRAWEQELAQLDADRDRERRLAEARLADVERQLEALRTRLPAPSLTPSTASAAEERWLREQERQLEALAALAREQLAGLGENARLAARTRRALGDREPSFAERLGDLRDWLAAVWRYELYAVDDRSITVGKVAGALLLFGLGVFASRALARGVTGLLRRRVGLDEGAAAAIQSLAFYLLLVVFFLAALRSVNIPLTAFTVLGGALAIGIGFGSQAIVNNFVSGIILMVERPIKVGDLVVFDGASGRVERIGPRSTRIRTFDNVHVIVPNSKLLETSVINKTLADDVVRTNVTVGVAYGSPTRRVEALLREIVVAHEGVLKHPTPTVMLQEFGADALTFVAEFWIRLSPLTDQRVVSSDIRHAIDETFRAQGISIAFPQRDVHLDTTRPLAVQVTALDPERGGS